MLYAWSDTGRQGGRVMRRGGGGWFGGGGNWSCVVWRGGVGKDGEGAGFDGGTVVGGFGALTDGTVRE